MILWSIGEKMINEIFGFVKNIISPVTEMIDDITTTDEEKLTLKNKLAEIENALAVKIMEHEEKTVSSQKEIIVAEIKSGWLSRSWRPILMLSITAIIVNNYILYPYLSLFGVPAVALELPEKLYNLMTIGVGGYVVGRSGEKIVEKLKK